MFLYVLERVTKRLIPENETKTPHAIGNPTTAPLAFIGSPDAAVAIATASSSLQLPGWASRRKGGNIDSTSQG
jgi:hypothetical protein